MSFIDSIHSLAKTVPAGTVLFEEGTAGGGIVVLLSGRLLVSKGGHRVGTISEAGSYVGESTFVTGRLRSATVVADTSATIIRLSAQQSAEFLQTPEAESKMIKSVTERLTAANDTIQEQGAQVEKLRTALISVLTALQEVNGTLIDPMDEGAACGDAARRIRVLVNRYGTEDMVGKPIVI